MTPALANFLFEAVNFALLAAVLGWLLFKPVRGALERERDHQVQRENQQAQRDAEAESLLEQARATRRQAEEEAGQRRDEIVSAARAEARRILEEARRAQAAERQNFEQELATRRSGEVVQLADTLASVASRSVAALLASLQGPDLDTALARAACSELKNLPSTGSDSALVESARSLTPAIQQLLEETLGEDFERRVIAELGAGVRITTTAGQIDATALSIARQAAREITAGDIRATPSPPESADG